MSDREEEGRGVKIVDRRRFDAEGNDRGEEVVPARPPSKGERSALGNATGSGSTGARPTQPVAPSPASARSIAAEEPSSGVSHEHGEGSEMHNADISFSSFIMSLATQALMQLGEVPAPPGVEVNVDRESAKHTIDILGMLHRKFGTGLGREEIQLLDDILHNLRMAYVRR